jgi:hypothetical protein
VTPGRVNTSVYRSPLRHFDLYRISYHYTLHIYSLALVCNCITISYVCGQALAYVPLHYIRFCSHRIRFAHEDRRVLSLLSKNDTTERKRTAYASIFRQSSTMPPQTLPEINCAWLVHDRVWQSYDLLGRVTPILT